MSKNNCDDCHYWTFLACHFGKWWIALFGALFLTSVEWGKKDND